MSSRSTVRISHPAKAALQEMAEAAGVSQHEFAEFLLNYAYSIHRRPGSWEAAAPFAIYTYIRPDTVADRWWTIGRAAEGGES